MRPEIDDSALHDGRVSSIVVKKTIERNIHGLPFPSILAEVEPKHGVVAGIPSEVVEQTPKDRSG